MHIETRRKIIVNTDPLHRCYHGVNFKEEIVWTRWEHVCSCTPENANDRLEFWQRLNDYAVKERGKEAKKEFRISGLGETNAIK